MRNSQLFSPTEQELFRRISCGDEEAFRTLFTIHVPKLEVFLTRMLKDDTLVKECIQDVFLTLWLRRSDLITVQNPSAYLHRMVANMAINQFRLRDRYQQLVENIQEAESNKELVTSAIETLSLKELQHRIRDVVNRLPEQRRTVFLLSKEEGLSRTEIAKKMHLSEKTVSNHLSYALATLREELHYHYGAVIPLILLLWKK